MARWLRTWWLTKVCKSFQGIWFPPLASQVHTQCTYIHEGKTLLHINKNKFETAAAQNLVEDCTSNPTVNNSDAGDV